MLLICRHATLAILALCVIACNRPMENPESIDPIYLDLIKTQKEFEDLAKSEEKTLEEHREALSRVQPQTGQVKYATKRVEESLARINSLKQEAQYYRLKSEERREEARREYGQAFENDKGWPDPNDYEAYLSVKKLRESPKNWSVEQRFEEFQIKSPKPPAGK